MSPASHFTILNGENNRKVLTVQAAFRDHLPDSITRGLEPSGNKLWGSSDRFSTESKPERMGWSTGSRRRSFTSTWSVSARKLTGDSPSTNTLGTGTLSLREAPSPASGSDQVTTRREREELRLTLRLWHWREGLTLPSVVKSNKRSVGVWDCASHVYCQVFVVPCSSSQLPTMLALVALPVQISRLMW